MSRTVEIWCDPMKGMPPKNVLNVADDAAVSILAMLESAYTRQDVTVSILHKPFVIFADLDGVEHVFPVDEIRRVKIYTKAAASQ